jgi:hypothetical protein
MDDISRHEESHLRPTSPDDAYNGISAISRSDIADLKSLDQLLEDEINSLNISPDDTYGTKETPGFSKDVEQSSMVLRQPLGLPPQETLHALDTMSVTSETTYYTAQSQLGERKVKLVPGQLHE